MRKPKNETLSHLTEDTIRRLVDPQSFERGKDYYEDGAILEPVLQGMELRADCQGSQYEPYRVTVTLSESGVTDARCTCPRDGFCKHIVALLLTYVHEPKTFRVIPLLEAMLATRNKEELIALVGEMVKREPDLVSLVELSVPVAQSKPIDVEAYRRRARSVMRRDEPFSIEKELRALRDNADRLSKGGDWLNAGALYHVLLEEITDSYTDELQMMDEEGNLASIADDCAQGLGKCLAHGQPDTNTRKAWLTTLLDAELTDIESGGIDFAASAYDVILEHATDEEWIWIEERVRAEIKRSSGWEREALVRFLSRPGKDASALIHELGTPQQRAFLLVEEGKIDEALEMARKHFTNLPGLITEFADALVKAGAGEVAVALLTEQTKKKSPYGGYVEWLAAYHRKHGDSRTALDWQHKLFTQNPSVENYKTLREVSKKVGVWEQKRIEVLKELEREKKIGTLIEIALHEDDVERALKLLPRVSEGGWGYFSWGFNYKEQVTKAAEKDYPQEAIALYKEMAEEAIGGRQRSSYQVAAQYLQRAKTLHKRLNAQTDWDDYIQALRTRYANLPALQDELRKAKL